MAETLYGRSLACTQEWSKEELLKCLELATGKVKWGELIGHCSLMVADGKLIVINERGRLIIAEVSPDGYREISACQAMKPKRGAKCWTAPVLCNGRLYLRTTSGELACLDMKK